MIPQCGVYFIHEIYQMDPWSIIEITNVTVITRSAGISNNQNQKPYADNCQITGVIGTINSFNYWVLQNKTHEIYRMTLDT